MRQQQNMTPETCIADLETMTDEQVRDNFVDLFSQALGIEESEKQQQQNIQEKGGSK